ncbi:MAG: nucleotidyl transferase AbiEii/AbiGii toxin family protein, partial [Rhodothermales bacterium]
MARSQPSNVAVSVRQRLLNRARAQEEDYQVLLTRYVLERFLYRLSQSLHRDRFVVKGAMLFLLWKGEFHRTTRDLDLLAFGSSEIAHLEAVVREICTVAVEVEDGIVFHPETIQGRAIREDQIYDGVRVTVVARLGSARLPLQIDIGFGDAIIPAPAKEDFPVLLDFPAPALPVYPRETVVAEKFQAMVELGITNSRMKDFYDLWYLSGHFAFDGPTLVRAITATFERRGTPLPSTLPLALTAEFADDPTKQTQWNAFLRRGGLKTEAMTLREVI